MSDVGFVLLGALIGVFLTPWFIDRIDAIEGWWRRHVPPRSR